MAGYPKSPQEAEARFYRMFAARDPYASLRAPHDDRWHAVEGLCNEWFLPKPQKPQTVEEWITLGRLVRAVLDWLNTIPPGTPITEEILLSRPGP